MLQIALARPSTSLKKVFSYLAIPLLSCILLWITIHSLQYLPEPVGSRSETFVVGCSITISLSLVAGFFGLILGTIAGCSRLSKNLVIRNVASWYVWLITGTPLLTQILFVYYVIPMCLPALKLDGFGSAAIALALNAGAYNAEVIRAGIIAVPTSQYDAAMSLGLSKLQALRYVIMPQAFKITLPPLVNNFVVLIKDSSLSSSIGLLELSLAGTRIISETFEPVPVLLTVSAIYFFLTTLFKVLIHYFDRCKNL